MLKLLGAVLLLAACGGWGFSSAWQLRQRLADLRELRRIASVLRQEIAYAGMALPEALRRIGNRTEGIFKEFLDSLAAELTRCPGESFHLIFSEQTDEILSRTAMEPADLADFKELGKYLRYLDRGMQLSNLDLYLSETEGKIERLTEELPARKKLFQTMGVLAGVFLAILFI